MPECTCQCNFCLTGAHCHINESGCEHVRSDDELWNDEMLAAIQEPTEQDVETTFEAQARLN
jgi:hypothetical protein